MNGALQFQWKSNIPGREAKSVGVFGKWMTQFEQMTKEGRLHGHREYFNLTGGSGGFMLIEGEVDELTKILAEEETIRISTEAAATVSDFEINLLAGGTDREAQELMSGWTGTMKELGYMK